MKNFLLFGGMEYYAGGGVRDLIAAFDSKDGAVGVGQALEREPYTSHDGIEWWHVVDRETMTIVAINKHLDGAVGTPADSIFWTDERREFVAELAAKNGGSVAIVYDVEDEGEPC